VPEKFFEEADKGMIRFKRTTNWWFYDEGIEFEDGTTLEADVVILATGYDGMKKLKAIVPEPFRSWLEFPWGIMPLYRYVHFFNTLFFLYSKLVLDYSEMLC